MKDKDQKWQQKQQKREYKLFVGEMKATNDQQGIIEGYLSTFGNIDYGLDRVMPGAFKRTLNNAYERKKNDGDDYLWPYLWNHDYDLVPPGGIFDANEDKTGLFIKAQLNLDYELARNMYSAYKAKMLKKQSMGYISHQQEYVKEDGQMIRNLIEEEILEGSGVVFPMNNMADVTGVKRQQSGLYVPKQYYQGFTAETKTVCGNTSGTIGPRDEKWDSSEAEKQIWAAAEKEDGSLNVTLCKKYFMVQDGDAQKKGSYSYPFWYVGDSPHICVGAVIAIAAAIGGARGADAPDGLKSKVETLYKRINKKYPDDSQLTPPWDGKSRGNRHMDKKDFGDEYRTRKISDWQSSFWTWFSALKASIMDAFDQGDDPLGDVQANLNGVDDSPGAIEELMKLIQEGIDLDFSNYLDGLEQSNPYGYLDYMSHRNPNTARKSGAAFSQDNTDAIHGHAAALHDMADAQSKAMHGLADGFLGALQGLGAPSDPSYRQQGTTADDEKSRHRPLAGVKASEADKQIIGQHATDLHGVAETIHQMAEDLAENTGATTYVDTDGNADDAKQTDKSGSRVSAPGHKHSLNSTAESQEEVESFLASLQELGKTL